MEFTRKRIVGAALGVALGVGFTLLCPDVGLSEQGVRCLGILIGAIVWWVAGVLPEWATGLLMVVLFAVAAGVGVDASLSAFTGSTWWLLVGAFALGAGMKSSGLMRRMALAVIRWFPRSFAAQSAGLMAAGTVLGPLIPSLAAKVSILEPIALSIGESMGYEQGGKQMQGLFMATLSGVRTIGPAAVTASIDGYALLAVLPAATQERFDLLSWFLAALPWLVAATVLSYLCIQVMYRPRGDAGVAGAGRAVPTTIERPGTMSRNEKLMLAIIVAAIALWIAEPLHHVASHVVALGALVAMVAAGILDTKSMRTEVNWPSLVFIGTMISMATVFSATGIQDWIVSIAQPVFAELLGNPYLFVLGIGIMTIVLRFLIVSEVAYINIMMALLVPLALGAGVEPWVVGIAIYATVNPWFVPYQNPIYLAAYYAVDGKMTSHAAAARYCAVYLACCLAALAISVPYWQWMGLL
ncbi:MAG: anion permease [Eggerthellaceae bacterium]|nr:anion permease [Eggerthellaceae bacterium]